MANITPLATEIQDRFLKGETLSALSKAFGLPRFALSKILDTPLVEAHTAARIRTLGKRVLEYRLRAFELAEDSLEDLANIRDTTSDLELKRKVDNDLIRSAGLEPRKVIQVNSTGDFAIDDETRGWMRDVLSEAGHRNAAAASQIVDAELDP